MKARHQGFADDDTLRGVNWMKWPEVPFGQVAEVVTGNTPPKKDPENYGPGVPWVKPPDLGGRSRRPQRLFPREARSSRGSFRKTQSWCVALDLSVGSGSPAPWWRQTSKLIRWCLDQLLTQSSAIITAAQFDSFCSRQLVKPLSQF